VNRSAREALASGLLFALILSAASIAQDEPKLAAELGLEGPLDNDTARACNDAATRELAKADPNRLPDALEAARRALVASAPIDAICLDPRQSIGIEVAVRQFLGANTAAFGARFEPLARAALDEAGNDERALERIEHEDPFTKSAVIASLRRFDLFYERGDRAGATAALARARSGSAAQADASIDAAIAARSSVLGAQANSASADESALDANSALDRAGGLVLASTIEYGVETSDDPSWHLQPGGVIGDVTWVQSAETLIAIDARPHAAVYFPREILAPLGASWNLAFGEEGRPWVQRPALDRSGGTRLALVLGRTKDKRGNALAVLDATTLPPRALWVHGESGFAHADGTRASEADALLPGRLEFEPGPVCFGGLVIAQVLQWHQPDVSVGDQHVETSSTSDWLVAFDARSGGVAWKQRIASGADRRARTASRFAGERGLSCACLPLALQSGQVMAVTELGLFARFDAASGALLESWRMRRARPAADTKPGFGGPFVFQGDAQHAVSFALAGADSDGVAYIDGPAQSVALPIDGIERLVAASDRGLAALVRTHGRLALRLVGTDSSSADNAPVTPAAASRRISEVRSVPLPRGAQWKGAVAGRDSILCAFDGRVGLFDLRRDLALRAVIDLEGLDLEGAVGLLVGEGRAYVLGTRRAWVLRL
jgi:hypothetical protein